MDPLDKALIVVCLFGGFALALPWMAWVRLKKLEIKHGSKLLVRGITGAQAARIILLRGQIEEVGVDETTFTFTDFYSAYEPAIKLSPAVYHGGRLFDVARAARLAGHALQHRDRKLGNLAAWDSFMILWGNAWPILFVMTLAARGRFLFAIAGFSLLAGSLTVAHLLKHTHIQDAARRGRKELEEAKLLDGHPKEEIDTAFLAARMDHLALPYSKTWWGMLFNQ